MLIAVNKTFKPWWKYPSHYNFQLFLFSEALNNWILLWNESKSSSQVPDSHLKIYIIHAIVECIILFDDKNNKDTFLWSSICKMQRKIEFESAYSKLKSEVIWRKFYARSELPMHRISNVDSTYTLCNHIVDISSIVDVDVEFVTRFSYEINS